MTFWSVVRGRIAACVQLTMNYLGCFTDVAQLLWGHSGGAQWQNCPWCPPAMLTTATVLGEFIDNFDKTQGLSAVTDEKDESDEYVCGTRASEKVESNMTRSQEVAVLTIQRDGDGCTKRLSFELLTRIGCE